MRLTTAASLTPLQRPNMKPANYCSCAIAYGFSLSLAVAQGPTLLTPGTSTTSVEAISTGTRTTFSLTGNTILSWEQLNLERGSELVYDFQAGDRVLNILTGSGGHRLDGTVTSNGIVGFFSPNANFDIGGSITAKGAVFATLSADADAFFSGGGYSLRGDATHRLNFDGEVSGTGGDVVFGSNKIFIGSSARIEADGSVLIGGGTDIRVSESGDSRLEVNSTGGNVVNRGDIRSTDIEVASGPAVANGGTIDGGEGQVFIEVGPGMEITNESNGVILGASIFTSEAIRAGVVIVPNEGDSAGTVSSGILTMPRLERPDGSVVSESQVVSTNVPVSASGDGSRDTASAGGSGERRANYQVEEFANARGGVAPKAVKGSLLKRSSFFGLRAGQGAAEAR